MKVPAYASDLAYIHDAGFSGYSLNASRGVLKYLRDNGGERGTVVDLGCGSGILARQLGFAGYEVLGVDRSASMLRIARDRAPGAKFVRASLQDVKLPKASAVLSIGEVFSFAFAGEHGWRELKDLFRRVHKALLPGGIFLFDFGQTGRYPGGMPRQGHWTGPDWAVLLDVEPIENDILTRHLTSFRKNGDGYRRRREVHKLRLFDPAEVLARVQESGFEARLIRNIGELRFQSGHAGVFARKQP